MARFVYLPSPSELCQGFRHCLQKERLTMQRFKTHKLALSDIALLLALALMASVLVGPAQAKVASGPTMPPDPWEQVVASGPTMPPDPWEEIRVASGPTMPPDPWEEIRVASGPTMPPDPWEEVRITA